MTDSASAAVGSLSLGVEVSHPSRTFGVAARVRARTDATVTAQIDVILGAGRPRVPFQRAERDRWRMPKMPEQEFEEPEG